MYNSKGQTHKKKQN